MTFSLIVPHCKECENDDDPVEVVCKDRPISSRILPTEQGIEDTPSTTAVQVGTTALNQVSSAITTQS